MSFAPRISPANRIRERLDLIKLIETYSTVVPLELPMGETPDGEPVMIPRGYLYTFSNDNLNQMIAEIVQHAYDDTFAMIKRKIDLEEK